MIRIRDTLAGDQIEFCCVQSKSDLLEVRDFIRDHWWLGFDTESTGINCYRRDWQLRTAQWGNATLSYVVPAKWRRFIEWAMRQPTNLIGHNGPHDIRCIDRYLGYETGTVCVGETYIPAHHRDSRGREDGGSGHGLKELAMAGIDPTAGKWEAELKRVFKEIKIEIPGEVYKSGPNRGTQKYRKAKLAEGWSLIDLYHPAYIAYAAADPVLTFRKWEHEQPTVKEFLELYRFDKRIAEACSKLQRRAMRLDVPYTERLNEAYKRKVNKLMTRLEDEFGLTSLNSPKQTADLLEKLGAKLTQRTDTGQYKTSAEILRKIILDPYANAKVKSFINLLLVAKQVDKRQVAYTEAFLRERDENDRVHPAINSLAARTARQSVSNPPLQQLPTKDREDELMWEIEE